MGRAARISRQCNREAERASLWIGSGQMDATHLNNLCARCHRGIQNVDLESRQAQMTNRFQPYGLMKSRCFLESGNSLSCLACHNPHTNASTNLKTYEAVCLTCHSSRRVASAAPSSVHFVSKVCPVNRSSGCIGCHMPKRPIFSHTDIPTKMADHFIRVVSKKL